MQQAGRQMASLRRIRGFPVTVRPVAACFWHRSVASDAAERKERGFWQSAENRRQFLRTFAEENSLQKAEDWRRVRYDDIVAAGGKGLMKYYPSIKGALEDHLAVSETEGAETFRPIRSRGHWESLENQRKFMDMIAADMMLEKAEDWRAVTAKVVEEKGGSALVRKYGGSVFRLLRAVYPEREWDVAECRKNIPASHWDSLAHRRAFMDRFAAAKGIKEPSGWSAVTKSDILDVHGGAGIMKRYKSVSDLLKDVFPDWEGAWDELLCRPVVPADYWLDNENIRKFLETVKEALGIRVKEDWYRVSTKQVVELRGAVLLRHMSLADALAVAYPKETWESDKFESTRKKSSQRLLRVQLHGIFRDE